MVTHRYAVFGNPIAQSKSPLIHQQFAKETQQDLKYEAILAPTDSFPQSLDTFFNDQLSMGANVTAPFKEEAHDWVNSLSDRARFAGAVNTIKRLSDGTFIGDNTDGVGLVNDLLANGVILKDARILILGAGGAAKGVLMSLIEQQPSKLFIYNRTESKAKALADKASLDSVNCCTYEELKTLKVDVVINSTSAGLSGNLPDLPVSVIEQCNCCYDMVYSNDETAFNKWAGSLGVNKRIDGLGMLVGQAAESFSIWRGVNPTTEAVMTQLREVS